MNKVIVTLALGALVAVPAAAAPQRQTGKQASAGPPGLPHTADNKLILFEDTNYGGDDVTVERPTAAIQTDWPVRSIAVHPGDSWEICLMSRFREPCIVLDHSIPDAGMIGIEGQIGSARRSVAARARRRN
jgi:hypothetical protein